MTAKGLPDNSLGQSTVLWPQTKHCRSVLSAVTTLCTGVEQTKATTCWRQHPHVTELPHIRLMMALQSDSLLPECHASLLRCWIRTVPKMILLPCSR